MLDGGKSSVTYEREVICQIIIPHHIAKKLFDALENQLKIVDRRIKERIEIQEQE